VTDRIAHIVVRIPMLGERLEDIIQRHTDVASADSSRSVFFGVRGKGSSIARCSPLIDQVQHKIPTFLYVVQLQSHKIRTFRSPIFSLSESVSTSDSDLIPPYYTESSYGKSVALWLKVGEFKEVSQEVLQPFAMRSTGGALTHVLSRGRASVLVVS
jgi:hypothetical protein